MTANAQCVYCRQTQPVSAFNREHVIPESFGTFAENFVLRNRVCQGCNSYFSRELELALGRDSMEGLERFKSGIAPGKKRRHIMNELVRATYQGGPYDGAMLEFSQCPTTGRLVLNPVPQLGFSMSPAGPVEWCPAHQLPSAEVLHGRGYIPGGVTIRAGGLTPDRAAALIESLGYKTSNSCDEALCPADSDGTIPIRLQGTINETIKRAVAKIAFNYLVFHYPGISLMGQFDPIRRYVRYGLKPGFDPVAISQESILGGVPEDKQVLVHVVTASWQHGTEQVLGQVSLFSWMQYRVTLAAEPFVIPAVCIDSGHVFDPFNKQILLLSRWIDSSKRVPLPLSEKEAD